MSKDDKVRITSADVEHLGPSAQEQLRDAGLLEDGEPSLENLEPLTTTGPTLPEPSNVVQLRHYDETLTGPDHAPEIDEVIRRYPVRGRLAVAFILWMGEQIRRVERGSQ